ncbi:hypothetical protein BU26DRAFT_563369 [Trematosphaeria pertusa]|uniref:BTB domain-containing protein n=1 Tax=Trematosphaeria pertusa TaxID=390896 RepID=A0A6A6INM6_9PLEO|nr:uncharacterized protein BU26DRAFT_563369 [Trematosphaeria pertusa]KAF2251432.1 hypothetical protein BU26DRAFT_563369 [Trematosphaeria pertusa]
MGAGQSAPTSCAYTPVPTDADDGRRIRPYGLAANSKHLQLNSSSCSLYSGIVSLVKHNKYADLLVICANDRYPVHRAIVCPRSRFFEELCRVRQGEHDYASPAKPTKIWIDRSECDSHVLAAVLTFLYTLDYNASGPQALTFGLPQELTGGDDDGPTVDGVEELDNEDDTCVVSAAEVESVATPTAGDATPSPSASCHSSHVSRLSGDAGERQNELVFHVQMYSAGHRFGIASLRDVAKDKFGKRLVSGPWNDEMIDCIREVYRQGNDARLADLREMVVKWARSRFRALKIREEWDDLIIEFPEFAAEMLRRL